MQFIFFESLLLRTISAGKAVGGEEKAVVRDGFTAVIGWNPFALNSDTTFNIEAVAVRPPPLPPPLNVGKLWKTF